MLAKSRLSVKVILFITIIALLANLLIPINNVNAAELERPIISNPDQGESYPDDTLNVNWQSCDDKDYYLVSLRDLTTNELLIDKKQVTSSNYDISSSKLTPGHTYRVAVAAVGLGTELWDEVDFSIQNASLEQPEISYPSQDTTYPVETMNVDWQSCDNKDYYLISLRDLTTNQVLINREQTTSSNYDISASYYTGGHEYRVAVGAVGLGTELWDEVDFSILANEEYKLSGYITDSKTGAALSGVTVNLNGSSNWYTTTNSSGYYEFNNVKASTHTVYATKSGYDDYQQNVNVYSNTTQNISMNSIAPVKYRLSGYVTDSNTEAALSGVTVNLNNSSNWYTTTNSSGYYEFNNVEASTHTIYTSKTGYTNYQQNVVISSDTTQNISLTAGTYTLSGYVTDSKTGLGIASATVTLDGTTKKTTDSTGYYSFTNVSSGTRTLTVTKACYGDVSQTVNVNGTNMTQNISLIAGTFTISGCVKDSITGLGIASATVTLDGTAMKTSDSNGYYSFTDVANGERSIVVNKAGYGNQTQSITVNGSNVTQNIVLIAGTYTISVKVSDSKTGAAIIGANVTLDGKTPASADSNGNYVFTGVANGSKTLTASKTGYGSKTQTINITSNMSQSIVLSSSVFSISGKVVYPNKVPMQGAIVKLNNDSNWQDTTDVNGEYTIEGVASSPHLLTVDYPKYKQYSKYVTVVNANLPLDPIYMDGYTISGYVYYPNSRVPMVGAKIVLNDSTDTRWQAYTDAKGYFKVEDAEAGTHTIKVSFSGYENYENKNIVVVDRDLSVGEIWLHGYQISGIVSDNGKVVQGADVYLNKVGDTKWHTTTDSSGYYVFNEVTTGTSHIVYVKKNGYLPSPASIKVPVSGYNKYDQNLNISPIRVSIYGVNVSYTKTTGYPFISSKGRTLVPLRATMEAFGANVTWDSASNTAYVKKGNITVGVPLNKNCITVNGIIVTNDEKATSVDGRTYCPIRKVLEAFGATVTWNDSTKTVSVNSTDSFNTNEKSNVKVYTEFVTINDGFATVKIKVEISCTGNSMNSYRYSISKVTFGSVEANDISLMKALNGKNLSSKISSNGSSASIKYSYEIWTMNLDYLCGDHVTSMSSDPWTHDGTDTYNVNITINSDSGKLEAVYSKVE